MPLEIERKFLVASDAWKSAVDQVEVLKDGLIARSPQGKVRVRLAHDRAWLAVKSDRRGGVSRQEFEYEIPTEDAEALLRGFCQGPILEKTRHCVRHQGHLWSVDVHQGPLAGLILAEVELQSEAEPLALPSWVGREVTHDPRYSKRNLLAARGAA
jgi:adenylate cyclase